MSTMSEQELQQFWRRQSEEFLDSDPSGWSVVCWTGMPTWLNALYHRAQRRALERLVRNVPLRDKLVLDVGTGVGRWIPFYLARGAREVIGIDIEAKRLSLASRRLPAGSCSLGLASAARLPFPDGTFDFVSSVAVLLHLDPASKESAIREICRITKPGGYVGILELIDMKTERPYVFPMPQEEWVSCFREQGLEPVKLIGNEYFPLLRTATALHRFAFGKSSREKRDSIRLGKADGPVKGPIAALLRLVTLMSYPAEALCEIAVPPRMARANGFLFVRKSAQMDRERKVQVEGRRKQ